MFKTKEGVKVYGKEYMFDQKTMEQIALISKSKAFEGQNIAIMPDAHWGKGACIGFTSTFTDKIIPNFVGVDVGCGMTMVKMPKSFIDEYKKDKMEALKRLQTAIRKNVPHGFNVHKQELAASPRLFEDVFSLTFELSESDKAHIRKSLGTLGGGNHFIELNESTTGDLYLVIHSGSRNLGQLVAKHHQAIAEKNFIKKKPTKEEIYAVEGKDRQEFIKNYGKKLVDDTPEQGMEYLVGTQVDDYLHDMNWAQVYASQNRRAMITQILIGLDYKPRMDYVWEIGEVITKRTNTIHNYIDIENKIIRKGSIFADPDNDIIIPLNMRDGSVIARGINKKEANFSAPHGAGRVLSRNQAKHDISLEDYKETMKDVVSWTVNENTLDEAPMAYKSKEDIIDALGELVEIKEVLKPVFNFKDDTPSRTWKKKKKSNVVIGDVVNNIPGGITIGYVNNMTIKKGK